MTTPVDRDEVQRLVSGEDAQLIEVLPAAEYEDEHLPGAINVPLKQLNIEGVSELERSRAAIVYCYDSQ